MHRDIRMRRPCITRKHLPYTRPHILMQLGSTDLQVEIDHWQPHHLAMFTKSRCRPTTSFLERSSTFAALHAKPHPRLGMSERFEFLLDFSFLHTSTPTQDLCFKTSSALSWIHPGLYGDNINLRYNLNCCYRWKGRVVDGRRVGSLWLGSREGLTQWMMLLW